MHFACLRTELELLTPPPRCLGNGGRSFYCQKSTFALTMAPILDFAGTFPLWPMTAVSKLYYLLRQCLLHAFHSA